MRLRETIEHLKLAYEKHELVTVSTRNGIDDLDVTFKSDGKKLTLTCSLMSWPANVWYCDEESDVPQEAMDWLLEQREAPLEKVMRELVPMITRLVWPALNPPQTRPGSSIELMELGEPIKREEAYSSEEDDDDDDDSDVEIQLDASNVIMIEHKKLRVTTSKDSQADDESSSGFQKWREMQNRLKSEASSTSSSAATVRLMKDAKEILTSKGIKDGHFQVDIAEEHLYAWSVSIIKIDDDSSQLARDMLNYGKHIVLALEFTSDYPFKPPKARIVSPVIEGGYVMNGGALCMELLTQKGWCSTYTIEKIILQIITTMIAGKARIRPNHDAAKIYSKSTAEKVFAQIEKQHDKTGWSSRQKKYG